MIIKLKRHNDIFLLGLPGHIYCYKGQNNINLPKIIALFFRDI